MIVSGTSQRAMDLDQYLSGVIISTTDHKLVLRIGRHQLLPSFRQFLRCVTRLGAIEADIQQSRLSGQESGESLECPSSAEKCVDPQSKHENGELFEVFLHDID